MYKVYVRDQYLNRVAEVDDYQVLDLILRFNTSGTWVLDLPTDCEAAREIVKDRAGIIVQKDNITIFSGPVTSRKRKWNVNEDKLTVAGADDLVYLQRNLAYPVPLGPPYSSQAYDIRTGAAETIMKQYVDVNIGPNSRSDRRIQNLTLQVDQGLGNNITGRARFHNLSDLISSLALSGGDLGFRVVQKGNNLEFQVYQPKDKTKEAVFSPLLGNLLDFEYSIENPETNYAIVGGGGEGTARSILERGDSRSITKYGRIETFIDRRDTSDSVELQQSMSEELSQKSERKSLSISPIDTESLAFVKNYNLGDKVSVELDGEVIKDVVREVKISITPGGEHISPVVGTPDSLSHPVLSMFEKMRKLNRRLSNLERR